MLACNDLTFTALNPDFYFLREIVALLNINRSMAFFFSNVLIYNYYSHSISVLNLLPTLILAPLPFIYKFITPKKRRIGRLTSNGIQSLTDDILNKKNSDSDTNKLNLSG